MTLRNWAEWSLPDAAIDRAVQFEAGQRRDVLAFGDFINELACELPVPNVLEISRRLAYESGGDSSTYRDYARVAAAFPLQERERFEVLSYSQLRACLAAEEHLVVAEWALGWADEHGGRAASVAMIYEHVNGRASDTRSVLHRSFHGLADRVERMMLDERLPVELRELAREFLDKLWVVYKSVRFRVE